MKFLPLLAHIILLATEFQGLAFFHKSTPAMRGASKFTLEKIITGIAHGASGGGAGYWLLQLLDRLSPSQWAAIGVLGRLMFGLLTWLTSLYFQIKADRRKAARGE